MTESTDKTIDGALLRGDSEISLRGRHLDLRLTNKLSGISNLVKIDLADTTIEDISFLEKLTNLRYLDLSDARVRRVDRVETISFANHLPHLETLICDRTHIRTLEPLRNATKLRMLSFRHTHISDVAPLAGLKHLRDLLLDYSLVLDFEPILPLTQLINSPGEYGLTFSQCMLARVDKNVQDISGIEDNKRRSTELYYYLKDASPTPRTDLKTVLAEMLLELPQQFSAPLTATISADGRQIIEVRGAVSGNSTGDELAEQGWLGPVDIQDSPLG